VRIINHARRGLGLGIPALSSFEVVSDGIWTWFTVPEAVQVGDYIYLGTVSSDGRCRAHRLHINTQTTQTFDLSGVLEVDDHNNASVLPLADGRVAFFYGEHNDPTFKTRVWDGSGAFTSSGSWSAQEARGNSEGPYSYPKPFIFPGDSTSGRVWLFHRRWTDGTGNTRSISYRNSATIGSGGTDPWSAFTDVLVETDARPYVVTYQVGDRVHFAISSAHPNEATFTTIRHFRCDMASGTLSWAATGGGSLTPPFAVSAATRADDGGNSKRWVSDVGVGADTHPRILWTKYPNGDGTAIEYWHSRWTGSAWVAHKITDDGAGLYAAEQYYHGGLRFHQGDVTKVYLSAPVSGVRQVQEWRTTDSGATWTQYRQITSGGTAGTPLKARPIGVKGGDGRVLLLWWQGTYTSFISYSTSVRAAG
jgi:hypothetical protein